MIDFKKDLNHFDHEEQSYKWLKNNTGRNSNFWRFVIILIIIMTTILLTSCDAEKRCIRHAQKGAACLQLKDSSSRDSVVKIVKITKIDTFTKIETKYVNVIDSGRADTSDPVIIVPINQKGIVGYFMFNKSNGNYTLNVHLPTTNNTTRTTKTDSSDVKSDVSKTKTKSATVTAPNKTKVSEFGLIMQGIAFGFMICLAFVFILLYQFGPIIKKAINKEK